MDSSKIMQVEIRDDKIAVVRINRVKKFNAFTFEMFVELQQAVNDLVDFNKTQKEVRCIIFTHEGKHFTAGLDLTSAQAIAQNSQQEDSDAARIAIGMFDLVDNM